MCSARSVGGRSPSCVGSVGTTTTLVGGTGVRPAMGVHGVDKGTPECKPQLRDGLAIGSVGPDEFECPPKMCRDIRPASGKLWTVDESLHSALNAVNRFPADRLQPPIRSTRSLADLPRRTWSAVRT